MNDEQKGKLARYLKNSSRFLWGLGQGNQKKSYSWLKRKGFDFQPGNYGDVTQQLLEKPGIEKLITELVIPEVERRYGKAAIDYLRICWNAGVRPEYSSLSQFNLKDTNPFLEIENQYRYVERWGELAGLWFEEIEPNREGVDVLGKL